MPGGYIPTPIIQVTLVKRHLEGSQRAHEEQKKEQLVDKLPSM